MIYIREVTQDDIAVLIQLMSEFNDYIESLDPIKRVSYQPNGAKYFVDKMIKEANDKQGKVFVAEENNSVVGFIEGNIESRSEDAKYEIIQTKTGRINELFVTSSYRQRGVGKQLIQKMEKYFHKVHCDYIILSVFAPNISAREFYKNLGFEERQISLGKKI